MVDSKAAKQTRLGAERMGGEMLQGKSCFWLLREFLEVLAWACLPEVQEEGRQHTGRFQRPLTVGLDPRAWHLVPIKRRVDGDVDAGWLGERWNKGVHLS